MKRILSFGGGLQTTALAIMVAQGKVEADEVVFADTGAEKPETYWYMNTYIAPLLAEAKIPFSIVRNERPLCQPDLYGWFWRLGQIPPIHGRRLCSNKFKREVIEKYMGKVQHETIIGFSFDEMNRAAKNPQNLHPLIDMRLSSADCQAIITGHGFPVPLKSSCYFCPFQHPVEWNWIKSKHPELFKKALELEAHYHERRPDMREFGLVRGVPLRKFKDGLQPEMFTLMDGSCWSGHCGH